MLIRISIILFAAFLTNLPVNGQEIGLRLQSLRHQFKEDAEGTMQKVKEMGFTQVELESTYGLTFPEFIKLLAINNLNVISYATSLERLEKSPQSVVDEARSYGARYIVCSSLLQGNEFTKEDADHTTTVLNDAGKILARNGLLLCYQPQDFELQPNETQTLFDYLVAKVEKRYVHFEMDVFLVKQAGQDPVALLKKYPTRFVLMNLRDRKSGTSKPNVALGKGDVGIANVMKTAKELGIQYFFIEDESPKSEQQIPESLAFLKSLN